MEICCKCKNIYNNLNICINCDHKICEDCKIFRRYLLYKNLKYNIEKSKDQNNINIFDLFICCKDCKN